MKTNKQLRESLNAFIRREKELEQLPAEEIKRRASILISTPVENNQQSDVQNFGLLVREVAFQCFDPDNIK